MNCGVVYNFLSFRTVLVKQKCFRNCTLQLAILRFQNASGTLYTLNINFDLYHVRICSYIESSKTLFTFISISLILNWIYYEYSGKNTKLYTQVKEGGRENDDKTSKRTDDAGPVVRYSYAVTTRFIDSAVVG